MDIKLKARPIGATAKVGRFGHPKVTSDTGGEISIVTGASETGFNPLDLMFSSLAACLVLSGRIAAGKLGLLEKLRDITVHVTGEKSHEEPFRITCFLIKMTVEGDFDGQEKQAIAHQAEDICTVSNTLKSSPDFSVEMS